MSTLRIASKFILIIVISYNFVGVSPGGFLNFAGLKNSLLNWTYAPNSCNGNSGRLLNLVNLVCSTAQAVNSTARDACYGCFARFVSLPQGQQQLVAISLCATMYFSNTLYAPCATRLASQISNPSVITTTLNQCTTGYCEFVQCLRRTNSNNLITQCSREVRAAGAVNVTIDADNIRYFTNMTSCILAKTRCGIFNPITGDPQFPGLTTVSNGKYRTQVALYNTLQIAPDATLRIVAFPATVIFPMIFCTSQTTLSQSNWVNNECP